MKQNNVTRPVGPGSLAVTLLLISGLVFAATRDSGYEWIGLTRASAENAAVRSSAVSETIRPAALNPMLPPVLGTYPGTAVELGANATITPSAAPTGTTRINVSANSNFKGVLTASPSTGVVRVTNAHSAGTYIVTVKAFDGIGATMSRTFSLNVRTLTRCSDTIQLTNGANVGTPGNGNSDVAVGDLNNDGNQDLAATNTGAGTVSLRFGNGSGGFSGTTEFGIPGGPLGIAIGDLNGDGNQDLATANRDANTVSIRIGNGAGGFSGTTDVPVQLSPQIVAIGDLNNDGNQDLAVTNFNSSSVSIRLGDGLGGFTGSTNVPVGVVGNVNNPLGLALGDFNGDGIRDFAAANSSTNPGLISIRLGDGSGNFSGTTEVSLGGRSPRDIAVGDFNNDGIQDIATTSNTAFGAPPVASTVSIRFGNGSGGFSGTTEVDVGLTAGSGSVSSLAIGDLNKDGNQDVVATGVVGGVGTFAFVRVGNGAGGFSGSTLTQLGNAADGVAIGEFTNDTIQDFATTSGENFLSIRLGTCNLSPVVAISGNVTYGNAIGPPLPRPVSNVTISGAGSPNVFTTTAFPGGNYTLSGFGSGPYTVTPSKTGALNSSITSFDAARISQHVSGLSLLTGNQLIVADVSGNSQITSFDAAQIAQFVASGSGGAQTGTWRFSPANRNYASVAAGIMGEDYSALLMGEVSGNWNDTGARPVGSRQWQSGVGGDSGSGDGREKAIAVSAPGLVMPVASEVIVPVTVDGIADKGIIAYEFVLRYDPAVIQPQADPVDLVGTVSSKLSVAVNADEPGLLKVAVYGPLPIDRNGVLLNLRFTAVGAPGSVSPLTWERIILNEGEPEITVSDGQVEISVAPPNQTEISGRLLGAAGESIICY